MPHTGTIAYPKTARPASMTARQVATAYQFPLTHATGRGYVGGFIELGGGYRLADIQAYFAQVVLPCPRYTDVLVGSGANTVGTDADGEVQSDMIVAGSVAPDVDYRVYFADNSDESFLSALNQATHECHGVSISWGSAESQWDMTTMLAFEKVIADARARGVPVFVASGDSGPDDSTNAPSTDFPASAPSAIGCGGTRLVLNSDGTRASETIWDDNPWSNATGGGVSQAFPGRAVPDLAGNADPDTGYALWINRQYQVIGGTSLVAPLMLGLHALLWELAAGKSFDLFALATQTPGGCFDISTGSFEQNAVLRVPEGAILTAALLGQ